MLRVVLPGNTGMSFQRPFLINMISVPGIDQYRRPVSAGDMVNVMLNYGYALLEAECLRAINTVGLDAHVRFLT